MVSFSVIWATSKDERKKRKEGRLWFFYILNLKCPSNMCIWSFGPQVDGAALGVVKLLGGGANKKTQVIKGHVFVVIIQFHFQLTFPVFQVNTVSQTLLLSLASHQLLCHSPYSGLYQRLSHNKPLFFKFTSGRYSVTGIRHIINSSFFQKLTYPHMFMCSVNVDYLTSMRYGEGMHEDIFKGNITPTRTGPWV